MKGFQAESNTVVKAKKEKKNQKKYPIVLKREGFLPSLPPLDTLFSDFSLINYLEPLFCLMVKAQGAN